MLYNINVYVVLHIYIYTFLHIHIHTHLLLYTQVLIYMSGAWVAQQGHHHLWCSFTALRSQSYYRFIQRTYGWHCALVGCWASFVIHMIFLNKWNYIYIYVFVCWLIHFISFYLYVCSSIFRLLLKCLIIYVRNW